MVLVPGLTSLPLDTMRAILPLGRIIQGMHLVPTSENVVPIRLER